MIQVRRLGIPDVLEIVPVRHGDDRGFFSEVYNREAFAEHGIKVDWVQDNHSFSAARGVVRGLHFQLEPFAQDKLVRVARGRIFDIAVDLRRGSPSFGEWVGLELSSEKWNQILVPKGFAHGFVTLETDCEVLYKTSGHYSREHDRSIRPDDPEIGINWPVPPQEWTLSDKDRAAPLLKDAGETFDYRPVR